MFVSDSIVYSDYIPTTPYSDPPSLSPYAWKKLGVEVGTDIWGVPAGMSPLYVVQMLLGNGMPCFLRNENFVLHQKGLTSQSASPSAAYYIAQFTPDHRSECTANPPADRKFVLDYGPATRMSVDGDCCYWMCVSYLGPRIFQTAGLVTGVPVYRLYRRKNGVDTLLTEISSPSFTHNNDGYFIQLQTWGNNPVNLRMLSKRPDNIVSVDCPYNGLTPNQKPGRGTYNLGGDIVFIDQSGLADEEGILTYYELNNIPYGGWNRFGNSPDDSLMASVGDSNWHRDYVGGVWEIGTYQDYSADRIVNGKPGVFGGYDAYGAAKCSARDLDDRLTANLVTLSGNSATIGGYRKPGSIVTVA